MLRPIAEFERDEEGHWFARLSCGHTIHQRHRPPWESRPWVETQHGRRERIGVELDCSFCEMPELPPNLDPYKRTPDFDEGSLPEGLRKAHTTKAGVWATIEVRQGRLEYTIEAPTPRSWILRPGVPGVVEPQRPHRVRPVGSEALKVHVQFWRLRQDGNTTD